MSRYVAFLRAINVGGHTVPMVTLRRLFEEAGGADVETVIASGNVLFSASSRSAPALEKRIAARLEERLGYPVATFLRTPRELASIAAHRPFPRSDTQRPDHSLFVAFHGRDVDAVSRRRVLGLASDLDDFRMVGRETYWLCRGRVSNSRVYGGGLERALGQPITVRNATTVRRIAEMLG